MGGAATLVGAWTLLAAGSLLAPSVGAVAATAISFAAVSGLVVLAGGWPGGMRRPLASALAAASGFASYPAWVVLIAALGLGAGLAPRAAVAPGFREPLVWIPIALLAPFFEELLYRRLLLPVLRRRIGVFPAIAVTSALFALPHLEPWQMLGTFLVGLGLGAVFAATGDVWLCIALHAGLNVAALACGSPPVRWAFEPAAAAIAGPTLLALAARSRRPLPPPLGWRHA